MAARAHPTVVALIARNKPTKSAHTATPATISAWLAPWDAARRGELLAWLTLIVHVCTGCSEGSAIFPDDGLRKRTGNVLTVPGLLLLSPHTSAFRSSNTPIFSVLPRSERSVTSESKSGK